jgi:hypothetical protein
MKEMRCSKFNGMAGINQNQLDRLGKHGVAKY